MKVINNIDWNLIWSVTKDTVLPHLGTLTLNTVLFLILGFVLFLVYVIFLSKKKIFKRKPKYYNWAVKLYIPLLLCVFLYVFGQVGFIRGIYQILDTENETIVTSIYKETLAFAFETEESKNTFITNLQTSTKGVEEQSTSLVTELKKAASNNNTGITLVDDGKNKIADYLLDKYGDDIYRIGTYGMLNLSGAKAAHVNLTEVLTYEDYSSAMNFLLEVNYKDIELAIKDKLMSWYDDLLDAQYQSMIKSLLILLVILMSLPLIEFFIYKKWIEPKLKAIVVHPLEN